MRKRLQWDATCATLHLLAAWPATNGVSNMAKKTEVQTEENVPHIVLMAESNWKEKHVKPGANAEDKETARAMWMRHVAEFDGKTVAEYKADIAKKQPKLSQKHPAKPYTATQWLTWFEVAGVIEITE